MDASDALASLDLPYAEPYHDRRLPCADDSRIGSALKAFTGAPPVWQASFREAIDLDRADLLCVWSERIAALAVRLDSARPLVLGLVALSLADESADGEAILIAPLHRRSAEKLGADPSRIFDEAAGLTDLAGRALAARRPRLRRRARGHRLRGGRRRRRLPLPADGGRHPSRSPLSS